MARDSHPVASAAQSGPLKTGCRTILRQRLCVHQQVVTLISAVEERSRTAGHHLCSVAVLTAETPPRVAQLRNHGGWSPGQREGRTVGEVIARFRRASSLLGTGEAAKPDFDIGLLLEGTLVRPLAKQRSPDGIPYRAWP